MFLLGACPFDPGPIAEPLNIIIPDTYSKLGIENKSLSTKYTWRIQLGSLLNKPHSHSTFKFSCKSWWIDESVHHGPITSIQVQVSELHPPGTRNIRLPDLPSLQNRTCLEAPCFKTHSSSGTCCCQIGWTLRVLKWQSGNQSKWNWRILMDFEAHPSPPDHHIPFCHNAYHPPLIHHPSTPDGLSTQRPWKYLKLGRWNARNDQQPWRPGDTFAPEIWLGVFWKLAAE